MSFADGTSTFPFHVVEDSATPLSDIVHAPQNITAQDVASSSATGANNQTLITGVPTAGSAAVFALSSRASAMVEVTNTWTGTLEIDVSVDGGTEWEIRSSHQMGVGFNSSLFTANFTAIALVSGCTHIRVRATGAWTGTATVAITESSNVAVVYIGNIGTVKAASTAAARTDSALVVAQSPNSPWTPVAQQSAASYFQVLAGAGVVGSATVFVAPSIATGLYYLMAIDTASASPGDGVVTLVAGTCAIPVYHTLGLSEPINVRNLPWKATNGCVLTLSSTGGVTLTHVANALTGMSEEAN